MTITSTVDVENNTPEFSLPSFIASVEHEGERFARVVDDGPLDVAVAACPGWNLNDLVRHLGEIHLWAAANVAFPSPSWLRVPELSALERYWPELASGSPTDGELLAWYRSTHTLLVDVLRSAPHDVEAFTFLPAPTPLTMWARRQASEIAVHRADAERARGMESRFDPAFAGDMLDELLSGFVPLFRDVRTDVTRILRISATDVGEQWWVTMDPAGMSTSSGDSEADLSLLGTAADLYLLLWNRSTGSNVDHLGDRRVLDVWRDSCRVVWTR